MHSPTTICRSACLPKRVRQGFTLVEMLIVISIIALLMAIALPALNGARESARKTQCGARIGDLAKAALEYDNAKQHFPYRRTTFPGDTTNPKQFRAGWVPQMFRYNIRPDLGAYYESFDPNTAYLGQNEWLTVSEQALICPSDPNTLNNTTVAAGRLSYAINSGIPDGYVTGTGGNNPFGTGNTSTWDKPANGIAMDGVKTDPAANANAVNQKPASLSLSDLSRSGDGADYTIIFAENSGPNDGFFLLPWNDQQGTQDPSRDLSSGNINSDPPNAWEEFACCVVWCTPTAGKQDTGFNVIFPFNVADGEARTAYQNVFGSSYATLDASKIYRARPSSYHSGTFNIAFCGGNVKSVSSEIAYSVYARWLTPQGKKSECFSVKASTANSALSWQANPISGDEIK